VEVVLLCIHCILHYIVILRRAIVDGVVTLYCCNVTCMKRKYNDIQYIINEEENVDNMTNVYLIHQYINVKI